MTSSSDEGSNNMPPSREKESLVGENKREKKKSRKTETATETLSLVLGMDATDDKTGGVDEEGGGGEKVEGEEGEGSCTLTENTYSLIYTARASSASFFFALFFFVFQTTMAALALSDLVSTQFSNGNPLNVPPQVSHAVRTAGFLSLALSVPFFPDILDAIEKFHEGYDSNATKQAPGATFPKWCLAFTLQVLVGLLFLADIFVLVVQSTTVIGMFLNFAALSFITEVDDIAFGLAQRGYFSDSIKAACAHVSEHKTPNTKGPWFRRFSYIFFTAGLLAGYSVIIVQQRSGVFICDRLEIQLGDAFVSVLPVFSGYYKIDNRLGDGRWAYVEEKSNMAFLRYCAKEQAWVFNIVDRDSNDTVSDAEFEGLCNDWVSKSPEHTGFSILETNPSSWVTKANFDGNLEYQVDHFAMTCADCSSSTCRGVCEDNQCVCQEGQFGLNCQFDSPPCEMVDWDRRTAEFQGVGYEYSSQFEVLTTSDGNTAYSYGRPIYGFLWPPGSEWEGYVDVLVNLGRRYFMYSVVAHLLFPNSTDVKSDVADLLENFHPYYDWMIGFSPENVTGTASEILSNFFERPVFGSSAIDVGTASDSISPVGLTWSQVDASKADGDIDDFLSLATSTPTVLICALCSDTTLCIGGLCNNTTQGVCDCFSGFSGPLCELSDV